MVAADTSPTVRNQAGEAPDRGAPAWLPVASALLSTGVLTVALAGAPPQERLTAALVFGLLVAAPMFVGLVAWNLHSDDRFARLLLAAGAAFSLTALTFSSDAVLHSLGRLAVWLVVPVLLYLMLAFPSGRLSTRWDRRLMAAIWILASVFYLPTALVVEHFPEPTPWALCGTACPPNAFRLIDVDLPFVDAIVRPWREVALVLAALGVAGSLVHRMRRSSPMRRRMTTPVLAVAVVQLVTLAAYQWTRRAGSVPEIVDALGWLWLLTLPAVALSFAAGLANRRLHFASALQRLALRLRAPAAPCELRGALADALEDPSLRVVYWVPGEAGHWVDESGWPTRAPEPEPWAAVTEVLEDGRRVAAVIHDSALASDKALIGAAASYGLVVLENTRLIGELQASLRRLSESESRTAVAARGERERIERDLHDGAQQRLVALRINLALLAERLDGEAPDRAQELAALGRQVDLTIDEVRGLAHTPYPDVLAQVGLAEALRSAATRSPVRTNVISNDIGRFDAGGRGERLLLVPRGGAERRQARAGRHAHHDRAERRRALALRGPRRRGRLRGRAIAERGRAGEHRGAARVGGWEGDHRVAAGPRHARGRDHPDGAGDG